MSSSLYIYIYNWLLYISNTDLTELYQNELRNFFHTPMQNPPIPPCLCKQLFLDYITSAWDMKMQNKKTTKNYLISDNMTAQSATLKTQWSKKRHRHKHKKKQYSTLSIDSCSSCVSRLCSEVILSSSFFFEYVYRQSSDKIYTKQTENDMMAVWFLEVKGNHWKFWLYVCTDTDMATGESSASGIRTGPRLSLALNKGQDFYSCKGASFNRS